MIFNGVNIQKRVYNEIGDKTGKMIVLENNKTLPFDIKRLFYIYNVAPNEIRGQHANRNSSFVIICVQGSVTVKIRSYDEEETFKLKSPNEGIYLPKLIWKDMYNFSDDAVLLVLSDQFYDPNEYMSDFEKYRQEIT